MSRSVARLPAMPAVGPNSVQLACPGCGRMRTMRVETASRIRNGKSRGYCEACRRTAPKTRERHLRWWFGRFGVTIPVGVTTADYVAEHGLPGELTALVASLKGTPWSTAA